MATYPKDQFDDLPNDLERVGAHRGPRARGGGWIAFAWAVLATAVIIIGTLYYLSRVDPGFHIAWPFAAQSATPVPTSSPTQITVPATDANAPSVKKRKITVTVLNGTATQNLETKAAAVLKKAHWKIVATTASNTTTFKNTTVYYRATADKDVALGIAQALGLSRVVQSDVYKGTKITVVLGADYAAGN
jgi:hypothetical protein